MRRAGGEVDAAAYARGERVAVDAVDRWIVSTLRSSYRTLRDEHADLVQAVHLTLTDSLRRERFAGRSSFRTYVIGVTHRTAIARVRKRYRDREVAVGALPTVVDIRPDPYERAARRQQAELMHEAVLRSSPKCRRLWKMVFVDELSYAEIGQRLGIPSGTVKSRVWHCRKKLLDVYRSLLGVEEGAP